jgi:hypothetical protein
MSPIQCVNVGFLGRLRGGSSFDGQGQRGIYFPAAFPPLSAASCEPAQRSDQLSYSTGTSAGYHVRQRYAHTKTATHVQIWMRRIVRRGLVLDDATRGTIDVKSMTARTMSLGNDAPRGL